MTEELKCMNCYIEVPTCDCQWQTDNLPVQEAHLCDKCRDELWTALNPFLQLNKGWFRIDKVGAIVVD